MKSDLFDSEFLKENFIIDWGYTEQAESITYQVFSDWVDKGFSAPLNYLSDHRKEKRKSLTNVFSKFQSALVFSFSYAHSKKIFDEMEKKNNLKLGSYAFGFDGMDYHYWIKNKLNEIIKYLPESIEYQFTVDTAPILERDLALRAGLGWVGKNSMLIHQKHGSYFMIGSILLSEKLDLETKKTDVDHCGTCTACIDACPTNAILDNRTLLTSQCISTYTIEMFKEGPVPDGYPEEKSYFFGCDICQEVCPWNSKSQKEDYKVELSDKQKEIVSFFFDKDLSEVIESLNEMSNTKYRKIFKGTSLERTGRVGILKNLEKLFSNE